MSHVMPSKKKERVGCGVLQCSFASVVLMVDGGAAAEEERERKKGRSRNNTAKHTHILELRPPRTTVTTRVS
jgi:hypothetical protein